MIRKPLKSSMIKSAGYDGTTLQVEFKSGVVWDYAHVDASTAKDFQESPSPGKFFNSFIKDKFEGVKLPIT